jgi:hypothetical protein
LVLTAVPVVIVDHDRTRGTGSYRRDYRGRAGSVTVQKKREDNGIPVTEKIMAQAVPIVGAAGGAFSNVLFMNHFQDVARGHFTVLRLEEKYGADAVKDAYREMGVSCDEAGPGRAPRAL